MSAAARLERNNSSTSGSRLGLRAPDHRERSIASIIATTLAAQKTTANKKSTLRQRKTTPEGGECRQREQLPQAWVSPGRFHLNTDGTAAQCTGFPPVRLHRIKKAPGLLPGALVTR